MYLDSDESMVWDWWIYTFLFKKSILNDYQLWIIKIYKSFIKKWHTPKVLEEILENFLEEDLDNMEPLEWKTIWLLIKSGITSTSWLMVLNIKYLNLTQGMPFKYYHGRTGKVFNVNPRSIGVVVNKLVGNRIIPKRLHVRVEHLRPSQCRAAFVSRI